MHVLLITGVKCVSLKLSRQTLVFFVLFTINFRSPAHGSQLGPAFANAGTACTDSFATCNLRIPIMYRGRITENAMQTV
jgi:hypothetical protein